MAEELGVDTLLWYYLFGVCCVRFKVERFGWGRELAAT